MCEVVVVAVMVVVTKDLTTKLYTLSGKVGMKYLHVSEERDWVIMQ